MLKMCITFQVMSITFTEIGIAHKCRWQKDYAFSIDSNAEWDW